MNSALSLLPKDYWETFTIQDVDLEFLYNHLLEIETPQDPRELAQALIQKRIDIEKTSIEQKREKQGKIYQPSDQYEVGQALVFPSSGWKSGRVLSVRQGNNPEVAEFSVIEVDFDGGGKKQFASNLPDHALNKSTSIALDDEMLNPETVFAQFGDSIQELLTEELHSNPDLVQIAGKWFPRALLVDVNIGHLNLAEAVLDEAEGGPLPTSAILEQIELPTDVNLKLTEFSLNLALQEDGRFDEVGPTGEVLWFLRKVEPAGVQEIPPTLQYTPIPFDPDPIKDLLKQLESLVIDELQACATDKSPSEEIDICLTYPHWRAGTLPLCGIVKKIFPSALESPRIRFAFVDADTQQAFSGWVVRPHNYVFGLRDWYLSQDLFPGAIINIKKSPKPGEILIRVDKHRATREWMRTLLVGADGGVVFAVLKQLVSVKFDERMSLAIPDPESLDRLWEQAKSRKGSLEAIVLNTMRELSKLSPQGHVHGQELYTAVNAIKRCPPGPILQVLKNNKQITHLGDLYFRITDEENQEINDDA